MGQHTDHHSHSSHEEEEEEEEEEEALSLCDLPLEDETQIPVPAVSSHSRRSSSEPCDFFEFFSDFSSEMSSAEDIIFCGKLIPFKDLSSPIYSHQQDKRRLSLGRRSESLPGLRSKSINACKPIMRNSRSLDYCKLERSGSKLDNLVDRNSSVKSIGRGDQMVKRSIKPRWYSLMFGVVKPPKEMELRDLKSRKVRRNMMFPPSSTAETAKKSPAAKGSSKLLKVLSCRDYTSVAVTTSLYVPPA